jgi:hypothetical protein
MMSRVAPLTCLILAFGCDSDRSSKSEEPHVQIDPASQTGTDPSKTPDSSAPVPVQPPVTDETGEKIEAMRKVLKGTPNWVIGDIKDWFAFGHARGEGAIGLSGMTIDRCTVLVRFYKDKDQDRAARSLFCNLSSLKPAITVADGTYEIEATGVVRFISEKGSCDGVKPSEAFLYNPATMDLDLEKRTLSFTRPNGTRAALIEEKSQFLEAYPFPEKDAERMMGRVGCQIRGAEEFRHVELK